jgi:hypothetical protein
VLARESQPALHLGTLLFPHMRHSKFGNPLLDLGDKFIPSVGR